jgi:hypothetical protein
VEPEGCAYSGAPAKSCDQEAPSVQDQTPGLVLNPDKEPPGAEHDAQLETEVMNTDGGSHVGNHSVNNIKGSKGSDHSGAEIYN